MAKGPCRRGGTAEVKILFTLHHAQHDGGFLFIALVGAGLEPFIPQRCQQLGPAGVFLVGEADDFGALGFGVLEETALVVGERFGKFLGAGDAGMSVDGLLGGIGQGGYLPSFMMIRNSVQPRGMLFVA